jgi:probable O-glycosylation ligase (exosortase A-associated)
MRDILVAALVFGSIPFILKRPWFGIIVWTWIGFMNPHRLAWGFVTEMPVAMIVALATLIGLLMSKEPKSIPWTRESILLALFVLWMTITTAFAVYPHLAWEQWEKVAKIQLMIFVAMMLITKRERLHLLIWTIAVSIGFFGIKGGIFTVLKGGVHRVYGPSGSFISGNNEMGLALAMTVPLIYYLYRESKRWYVRWGLLAAMFLTSLAAIGTQSRGALLGMGAMGVMLWWKSKQKFFLTPLLIGSAAFIYAFMPQEWFDRMATIKTFETDVSAQGRFAAWEFAFRVAASRVVGGGFEVFAGMTDAHSIFFEVLGEHGFVGLGLFLMLGLFTWLSASRIRRTAEKTQDMAWMANLARMTQVSLVAYASAGAFLGMAYFDYTYNLVLIIVACQVILTAHQRGPRPAHATVHGRLPSAQPATAPSSTRQVQADRLRTPA